MKANLPSSHHQSQISIWSYCTYDNTISTSTECDTVMVLLSIANYSSTAGVTPLTFWCDINDSAGVTLLTLLV